MVTYTSIEITQFATNKRRLADCYLWVTTGKSKLGLSYAPMLVDRLPKKMKPDKPGWKKGVKRHYRGKAIKEGG